MATEKRLIDAERFKRILQHTARHLKGLGQHKMSELIESVIKNLDLQPTVDAVEVVRCKDCKYWRDSWVAPDGKHEHGYCYMEDADDVIVGRWGDDFCSYGEREDSE